MKEDDAFSEETVAETGVDIALAGAAEVVVSPVVLPANRDG